VPQLKDFPKKFIYEPWKAPKEVQKSCGCIIGVDYPHPIVEDHTIQSKLNMDKMKKVYDAAKVNKAAKSKKRNAAPAKGPSSSSKKKKRQMTLTGAGVLKKE